MSKSCIKAKNFFVYRLGHSCCIFIWGTRGASVEVRAIQAVLKKSNCFTNTLLGEFKYLHII